MSTTSQFDVFLSHNSLDKPVLRQLGEALKQRGLSLWFDEWELVPGETWQDAMEDIITNCRSAAVCVAGNGIGPWEEPEMQALLRRFVSEKKTGKVVRVIPVLLPGAPADLKLPLFLQAFTWVDLRDGITDNGLFRLVWGITGVKPGTQPPPVNSVTTSQSHAPASSNVSATSGALAIWREKLEYLQQQEAISSDPAQRFALKKQIEEAKAKIREFGG